MSRNPITRAMIYVCGRVGRRHEIDCVEHCEQHGYRVSSLLRDDSNGLRWSEAFRAAAAGEVDVVVTPSLALLHPDRVPRIEPVDAPVTRRAPLHRRRPRPVD